METLSLKTTKEEHVAGSYRQGQGVDCRAPREHSAHCPWRLSWAQGVTPPLRTNRVQVPIRAPLVAREEGLGAPSSHSKQALASLERRVFRPDGRSVGMARVCLDARAVSFVGYQTLSTNASTMSAANKPTKDQSQNAVVRPRRLRPGSRSFTAGQYLTPAATPSSLTSRR